MSSSSSCPAISPRLAVGAGCYWGTEKYIKIDFQKRFPNTIKSAKVGFMSPEPDKALKNPTYRQVCSGTSGHIEVLDIELNANDDNPEETSKTFEELIKFVMMFHDPTTKNRQGNDTGFQYASVIFTDDDQQAEIAHKVLQETQQLLTEKKITTYSEPYVQTFLAKYNTFYPAHEEHQEYLMKNPSGYCNHYYRFKTWPSLN